MAAGTTVFGIRPVSGTTYRCLTAATAATTYNKFGESTACVGGLGGTDANNVYQFTTKCRECTQ